MEEKKPTDDTEIDVGMIENALKCLAGQKACDLCVYDDRALQDDERTCINLVAEDTLDLIHRLQSENERLKDEKEEIKLFNLAIQNGEVDMRIESEMAKSFYNSIVQVFEQNGAKNFFTTTIDIEGKNGRYAFTIEKVGGQTVAEKLAEQKAEIERLTEELDLANETIDRNNKRYKKVSIERQKALDRVDFLEDALLDKIRRNEELITAIKQAEQQAVKDTAKEILPEMLARAKRLKEQFDSTTYGTNREHLIATIEIEIEGIKNLAKRYGIEVE